MTTQNRTRYKNHLPFNDTGTPFQYLLDKTIHLCILLLIVVLFIDGYATEKHITDRIETAYFLCILLILIIRMFFASTKKIILAYLGISLFIILLGIFISGVDSSRLASDVRYFSRSILIGALVFSFYTTSKVIHFRSIKTVFVAYWLLILLFVSLHIFFGIGGVTTGSTENIKSIFTSYFQSGNEVSFIFLLSWYFIFNFTKSNLLKLITTVLTILAAIFMSSKAITVSLFLLLAMSIFMYFERNSVRRKAFIRYLLVLILIFILLFSLELIELLLVTFSNLSPDGNNVLFKLDSSKIITLVLSSRDLKAMEMLEVFSNSEPLVWFFGLGSSELINERTLVESDPFDILKFYGIFGIIFYYAPLFYIAFNIFNKKHLKKAFLNYFSFFAGTIVVTIFTSTATGHILTSPATMLILGLIFGTWFSSSLREEFLIQTKAR